MTTPQDILSFWFDETDREKWFVKDPAFDAVIGARFGEDHRRAAAGGHDAWRDTADGCLALIILLDQFSRNLHRDSRLAFACDPRARAVAHRVLDHGFDRDMAQIRRVFLYLPFEHSEDIEDQHLCVRLAAQLTDEPGWLDYAKRHRDIILRFRRFPHRNAALGRRSTAAEVAFLEDPDSSF